MKPSKTFKLTKRNKTMIALFNFKDEDTRAAFRAMMIQAQLQADVKIKSEPRKQFGAAVVAVDSAV